MAYIYRAKKLLGGKMPRIDIRITDLTSPELIKQGTLAQARLKDKIIWVPGDTLDTYKQYLHEIVFHELLHTIYGIDHKNNCPLMDTTIQGKPLDSNLIDNLFLKYAKEYGN